MDNLEAKVAELEERLTKAATAYKAQKEELKEANARIKELESAGAVQNDSSALQERIKELEDEIAINGNSSEEIKTLNARLEKAKAVFAEQKAKIAEFKKVNEEQEKNLANAQKEFEQLHSDFDKLSSVFSRTKDELEARTKACADIKAILNSFEN